MPNKSKTDVHRRRIAREIQKQQSSTRPTIPRQSYTRVVQEIIQNEQNRRGDEYDINLRADALDALQAAGEELLTEMFAKANNLAVYAGRDTVNEADLRFINGAMPVCRGRTEACVREPVPLDVDTAPEC